MQYFKSRTEAGRLLLEQIRSKGDFYINPAVIALSSGGSLVASEIARGLHASLYIIETETVDIPGEGTIGTASTGGNFVYSSKYSDGQLDYLKSNYHQVIGQEQFKAFQKLNRIIGHDGVIKKELLKRHEIILVSDSLEDRSQLEVVIDYLKPIEIRKLIIATPITALSVVDYMHLSSDQIFCLGVVENYLKTDHYYTDNILPTYEQAVQSIRKVVFSW